MPAPRPSVAAAVPSVRSAAPVLPADAAPPLAPRRQRRAPQVLRLRRRAQRAWVQRALPV